MGTATKKVEKELKRAKGTGSIEEAKLVSQVPLECELRPVDQQQFWSARFMCKLGRSDESASRTKNVERVTCVLLRVASVCFVLQREQRKENLKKSRARSLNLIKSGLDILVAAGLLQLAPKSITPRVTGGLGFITSVISCYQVTFVGPN